MAFRDLLQQAFAQTLAVALEHFVWQGAVLGLALYALVRLLRPTAHVRYLLGVACLAAMASAPVVTIAVVSARGAASSNAAFTVPIGEAAHASAVADPGSNAAAQRWNAQAVVVSVWLVGVLALSLRLAGGWVMTRRLVSSARDRASIEIRLLTQRLGQALALGSYIDVLESPTVAVPMLIGWIAPVIILPTAALSGLAPAQLEALIAHELAHVRRHDYLVNLLQSMVETLLFFHPAVWWVSRDVRESREHCCDDLVVGLCDRVVYATALADLAAIVRGPRLALAATDGSLVSRVRRILGGTDDGRPARQEWMAAAVLALLVVGTVPIAFASARQSAAPQGSAPVQLAAGLQEPAVAIRPDSQSPDEHLESNADRVLLQSLIAAERPKPSEERVNLEALAPELMTAQDPDLQTIQLKLQRELEELNAQVNPSQELQDRQAEVKAALEKLRAMVAEGQDRDRVLNLEERQAREKQLQERKIDVDQLQAKLAAIEDDIANRTRSLDQLDQDKIAEAKAKLDRIKPIELDEAAMKKLKEARLQEAEETLNKLAQARASLADDETIAKLKAEASRLDEVFAFKVPQGKIVGNAKPDKDGNVVVFEPIRRGNTDLDPKEIQSVIAPAFDAGPNDISVVGKVVRHPGRVEWHDGMTVEAALKAAGAPPINNTDNVVRLLSAMQVTFGAGGPHVTGRVDDVNADTTLRPGDVIVVSPRVRK